MKKPLIAIAAAFLALTPAISSAGFVSLGGSLFVTLGDSFTLDQLIAGQTITAGNRLFSGFQYSRTGDMPLANAITVQNIVDSQENYGLLFTGNFLDLIGGVGASDALLSFNVTNLGGRPILGANLFGDPTVTGTGLASITETFQPSYGSMNIFDNTNHTGLSSNTYYPFKVVPTTLSVQKDILAFAANANSVAGFTQIGQTFGKTPLPASLVILLTGALSAVPVYCLRRRKD